MLITKEQIERFFDRHCSKEEADRIAQYLEDNPQVLRKYIMQDWKDADGSPDLPASTSEQMLQEIRHEIFTTRRIGGNNTLTKRAVPWMAAALVLLIAGLVLLRPWNSHDPALASVKTTITNDTAATPSLPVHQVRFNNTLANQAIVLPDGSVATLSPNSRLRYDEPFAGDKRALTVDGEASFKVVKEEARPFTVSAGPILTTVLGTEFNVAENGSSVTIKLYSGKVRLQPNDRTLKGWQENIILLPGEQMKYTADRGLVEVSGFGKIGQPDQPAAEPKDNNDALVFDKKRLPEVLDKLANRYHTHIAYDRRQIGGLYFTGTVLTADSLVTILEVITNMNELMIVQDTDGFIIQRKIP